MSEYDASALIAICESILEDGELSGEELYGLADWLNNHRDACFHWPGDILVQPLQNIWADGKITKTELRSISHLLLRIRKEWAKRQAQEALQRATEVVAQIALNFDLRNAQVPSIPLTLLVKSHSEKGVLYDPPLPMDGQTSSSRKGAYDRFGYNVLESRWSYGIFGEGLFEFAGRFEVHD